MATGNDNTWNLIKFSREVQAIYSSLKYFRDLVVSRKRNQNGSSADYLCIGAQIGEGFTETTALYTAIHY